MAYKLYPSASFRYPVYLPQLGPDGKIDKTLVRIDFKRLDSDALDDFQRQNDITVRLAEALERANGDQGMAALMLAAEDQKTGVSRRRAADKAKDLMQILHGWEPADFEGPDGPAEFTLAALEQLLLACPTADGAIRAAFNEAHNGGKKEEEIKNSSKPRTTG